MKLLIIILFLSFSIHADPLEPLPTDFIDNNKIKNKKPSHTPKTKKDSKKNYKEIIKDMEPILGFFDFSIKAPL